MPNNTTFSEQLGIALAHHCNSIPTILAERGIDISKLGSQGGQICDPRPNAHEKNPSFSIFQKNDVWLFKRHGGDGATGNAYQLLLELGETPQSAAEYLLRRASLLQVHSVKTRSHDAANSNLEKIYQRLAKAQKYLNYLQETPEHLKARGFTSEMCKVYGLGLEANGLILIPVQRAGKVIQVKQRHVVGGQRYSYLVKGGGSPAWTSPPVTSPKEILIIEGELNAMIAHAALMQSGEVVSVVGVAGASNTLETAGLEHQMITIYADGDPAGCQAAINWAKAAGSAGAQRVSVLEPLSDGKDFCDLAGQHGLEALSNYIKTAKRSAMVEASTMTTEAFSSPDGSSRHGESVRALVEMVKSWNTELFCDHNGIAYISFDRVGTTRVTMNLNDQGFEAYVRWRLYTFEKGILNDQSFKTLILTLQGIALYDGDRQKVYLRVAQLQNSIYLDLGREDRKAIEITANGWHVIEASALPVKFICHATLEALPLPVLGGSLRDLLKVVNVEPADYPLLAGWLLSTLSPQPPYPVLLLEGVQGSAKSSTATRLKRLVDPSGGIRSAPETTRDLMISALYQQVLVFDNLSKIGPKFSDDLCRLATGGTFAIRTLYSNTGETVIEATRPVIITSIDGVVTRSDLLDPSVVLTLPEIGLHQRRSQRELDEEYETLRPELLGALLTAVSAALANRSTTRVENPERLADFCVWVTASESALGINPGDFMASYRENRHGAKLNTLNAYPFALALVAWMMKIRTWNGSAAQLYKALDTQLDATARNLYPKTPQALMGAIRRLTSDLQSVGLYCKEQRRRASGTHFVFYVKD